jgi:hypothetical protein
VAPQGAPLVDSRHTVLVAERDPPRLRAREAELELVAQRAARPYEDCLNRRLGQAQLGEISS